MHARLVSLIVLFIFLAPLAGAVTIDDFSSGLPSPGTLVTDGTGVASASQSALASVLGGDRDTVIKANIAASPTGAQILSNPNPPPVTDIVNLVMSSSGGSLELSYPGLSSFDMTLGGGVLPTSFIVVRSTLMVSGASLAVTLTDGGGVAASHTLPTSDFSGTGDQAYLFSIDPASFTTAGLDLGDIDKVGVELTSPFGQDFEISDVSVVPISAKTTNWANAFAFQSASGAENPALLVSFLPQIDPGGLGVNVDMSEPTQPQIVLSGVPPEEVLEFRLAPYGGLTTLRSTAISANHFEFGLENGELFTVVIDVSSSGGQFVDPSSLVGFNPQPEPPAIGLVGFNPQPEPPALGSAVGYEFEMESVGAFAGPGEDETITLSFQILDEAASPISLELVKGMSVPTLSPGGLAWLCAGLLSLVYFARSRAIGRRGARPSA